MTRSCLLPLLLWSAARSVGAAEALQVEDFTRDADLGQLQISPDGAFLAGARVVDGDGTITFFSLPPNAPVTRLISHDGGEILALEWASPTRLLYTLARRRRGLLPPIPTGEVFAAERDGTPPLAVHSFNKGDVTIGEVVDVIADEGLSSIICEYPRDRRRPWAFSMLSDRIRKAGYSWQQDFDGKPLLSSVDIHTAKKTVIEELPLADASPLLDATGRARFVTGFGADGRVAVMWRRAAEWIAFEPAGFRRGTVAPQRITSDGRSLLLIGTRTDEALSGLYRFDLETGALTTVLKDPDADIERVVTDLAADAVIGVRVHADRPRHYWLDPEDATTTLYDMMERAFPDQSVSFTSATADGRLAIAFVQSDVNPGAYYLVDTRTRKADALLSAREAIDPASMRHKEAVQFASRDGVTLHGYLTRPRDASGPYPLIVRAHGGFDDRDRWDYDAEVQLFAHYGYAVLQVNYRGSSGYGRDFLRAGYGEWGERVQDDITDATLWAVEHEVAERGNICIYGRDTGGYAALMGAVREPALYRCVAAYGAITDLQLMFETGSLQRSAAGRVYLAELLGRDPNVLRARSPVHNATRIEAPVLLLHDQSDTLVRHEHATRMRTALRKAGVKVELVELAAAAWPEDEAVRAAAYGTLLDFFAQHLHGGRPIASE